MIGWHEVDFHHLRECNQYNVRCCPIGNKDDRLLVESQWKEWKNGDGPFTEGVWDEGERDCFQQLRAKLQELEAGCVVTPSDYVLEQLHVAEHRVKELEEEIEAMRVTDPSELAAQLLNMKALVDAAKDLLNKWLAVARVYGEHSGRLYAATVALLAVEDIKVTMPLALSEVFLPDDTEPLSDPEPPRVERSEPGGYDAPVLRRYGGGPGSGGTGGGGGDS